ncbi:MAG: GatB/YqeY domain-containing protein [Candidatus Binatia bacterium]
MTTLSEPAIQERLREAMRARATDQVMVLRGLVAAIKNRHIERRTGAAGAGDLDEAEITQIIRREIKQREEAMSFAEQGNRAELVEKNRAEKTFLESFLPQAVSREELRGAISRHHQTGAADIGALMAKLKQEYGARLDGRTASEAVRAFLREQEGS